LVSEPLRWVGDCPKIESIVSPHLLEPAMVRMVGQDLDYREPFSRILSKNSTSHQCQSPPMVVLTLELSSAALFVDNPSRVGDYLNYMEMRNRLCLCIAQVDFPLDHQSIWFFQLPCGNRIFVALCRSRAAEIVTIIVTVSAIWL
jgi:hypothetical protein